MQIELEVRFKTGIFILDFSYEKIESDAYVLFTCSVDSEYGMGSTRNSVAEVAAIDFYEGDFMFHAQAVEEAGEEFVGVCASQMYVAA